MRFAYDTAGLVHHRLEHAVELVADAGYDGLALTLDHHHLDPLAPALAARALRLRGRLDALGLGTVVQTGAPFLLDPRTAGEPTLVSASDRGRERRLELLLRAVDAAEVLGSECVRFAAGTDPAGDPRALDWLREGIERLREHAVRRGVVIALEPVPGTVIADLADVRRELPDGLPLALDVGHALNADPAHPGDPAALVRACAGRTASITVADRKRGGDARLPFGDGDLDLPAVLRAIRETRFAGLVCVNLDRDAHRADAMLPRALGALRAALG